MDQAEKQGKRGKKWKWTKKKIFFVVLLLIIIIGAFSIFNALNASKPVSGKMSGSTGVRTTILKKDTLYDSVTVTGTVKSNDVANVTTLITNTVKTVNVQVGDKVNKGDTICTLDPTEIEKQIAKKKTALNDAISTAKEAYDKAVTSYNTAKTESENAEPNVTALKTANDVAHANFQVAITAVNRMQVAYDEALLHFQTIGAAYTAETLPGQAEDAAAALLTFEEAKANLAVKETKLATAKEQTNYNALEKTYAAANGAYTPARSSLNQLEQAATQASEAMTAAKKQLDKASEDDELTTLQESLEDCTITATQAGTVTTLNATVGASTKDATIATIQDVDNLIVSVTIDEDSINKIKTGQKVIIKSDATGDAEISGTVTQLSLTASTSAQGGTAGFGAEISVTDIDSGLLIGLSAKAEIVISQSDNVYSVPYDAVETDEAGKSVIYVQNGTEFEPIEVTLGAKTDYYIAITGDTLKDGMAVRVSANDTAAPSSDTMQSDMIIGGADGGTHQGTVSMTAPAAMGPGGM